MNKKFNIILFDGFETLDAFGPAEIIGRSSILYDLAYYSLDGGIVTSAQNIKVLTLPFEEIPNNSIILIPGGPGTRILVKNDIFIEKIKNIALKSAYILTVCTGSVFLALTDLLDNKRATTNKMAFDWVCSHNTKVIWEKKARWVLDGNIYTSSGVSAGMDMTLGFLSDLHGEMIAAKTANDIEYIRNKDKNDDPFYVK